jgi:DNA-binding PadR family transcriptional regulator
MYADSIYATHHGRCGKRHEAHDLGTIWQAMTGERGARGPGGRGERQGHRGRHGHGPGFGPGGFGFGPGVFGPGGPRGRGRKARRGDIRTAALLLLAEEPRNGYQIMQEVQERSDGVWRPSPGSVYPALQQLEDEGLIRSQESDGRKLFAVTDAGRKVVEERGEDQHAPWEQMSGEVSDGAFELGRVMKELAYAFAQVMRTGSETQVGKAGDVLAGARRDLYRILADGDDGATGTDETTAPDA